MHLLVCAMLWTLQLGSCPLAWAVHEMFNALLGHSVAGQRHIPAQCQMSLPLLPPLAACLQVWLIDLGMASMAVDAHSRPCEMQRLKDMFR